MSDDVVPAVSPDLFAWLSSHKDGLSSELKRAQITTGIEGEKKFAKELVERPAILKEVAEKILAFIERIQHQRRWRLSSRI